MPCFEPDNIVKLDIPENCSPFAITHQVLKELNTSFKSTVDNKSFLDLAVTHCDHSEGISRRTEKNIGTGICRERFVLKLEIRKKNGAKYTPNSMHHIVCGIMTVIVEIIPLTFLKTKNSQISEKPWMGK